jgi:alanine dehydrogenase
MIRISEEQVREILTMEACLREVETAYRADGRGEAQMFPRRKLVLPDKHSYKILSGALPSLGVLGTLGYTGGYPRHRSPFECRKLLTLFNAETGEPLACLESEYLSWLRTGATAGVAVRHLALPEVAKIAIIGSGRQARSSLMAVHLVREIQEVQVFSPTPEHRQAFANEMAGQLNVTLIPAATAREAVRDAQVVITATSHHQPVFFGSWLEPGTTIIALGAHDPDRRELDGGTLHRADLVVVDHREQALQEEGEIILAREEGFFSKTAEPITLGEVVAGRQPGRCTLNEKIVFLSGGIALEYLTVGFYIYKKVMGIE